MCEWDASNGVTLTQTIPINLNRGVNSGTNNLPQCKSHLWGSEYTLDESEIIMSPKLPSRLISAGEWWPLCTQALLIGYTKLFFILSKTQLRINIS